MSTEGETLFPMLKTLEDVRKVNTRISKRFQTNFAYLLRRLANQLVRVQCLPNFLSERSLNFPLLKRLRIRGDRLPHHLRHSNIDITHLPVAAPKLRRLMAVSVIPKSFRNVIGATLTAGVWPEIEVFDFRLCRFPAPSTVEDALSTLAKYAHTHQNLQWACIGWPQLTSNNNATTADDFFVAFRDAYASEADSRTKSLLLNLVIGQHPEDEDANTKRSMVHFASSDANLAWILSLPHPHRKSVIYHCSSNEILHLVHHGHVHAAEELLDRLPKFQVLAALPSNPLLEQDKYLPISAVVKKIGINAALTLVTKMIEKGWPVNVDDLRALCAVVPAGPLADDCEPYELISACLSQ
jgi:hypothetical protein